MSSRPTVAKSKAPASRRRAPRGPFCIPVHTWFDRVTDRKLADRAAERGISKPELVRTIVESAVGSHIWTEAERIVITETLRNQELLGALLARASTPEEAAAIRAWVDERTDAQVENFIAELDAAAGAHSDGRR